MTPDEQRAATMRAIALAIYQDKTLDIVGCWELITTIEAAYDAAMKEKLDGIYIQESNEKRGKVTNGARRPARKRQNLHITANRITIGQ